jgi:hypothetical protein
MYYKQLVGATIEQCVIEPDTVRCGEDGWPTFLVRTAYGECLKLQISQDEEGNGPGFMFIEDISYVATSPIKKATKTPTKKTKKTKKTPAKRRFIDPSISAGLDLR